jgi:AraC family transcriptional activator of pobA
MDQLFHIFKITREDARMIALSPEEPHNHDFEELIVGMEGALEHFIDFKSDKFVSPFVSFVTKGKIHCVKPVINDDKFSIWVLQFKSEFDLQKCVILSCQVDTY